VVSIERWNARWLASVLVGLVIPGALEGQVCFRGHPSGRCDGFVVLEFTSGAQVNQQPESPGRIGSSGPLYLSWEAGYLHNIGARSALGAAARLAADDDGHRVAGVLRYRQWLGHNWSLDLSPGVLVEGNMNFTTLRFPSVTAGAAVNWGDRLALTVGVDQLRQSQGDHWAYYAGLRFGSWLAPLAMLGLVALAGATY
jgi:hypothetical protein